jgi:glycerol 3-phosphatase-2
MTDPDALIRSHDAVLSDLDGVVYAGPRPVPGAVEAYGKLEAAGVTLAYVTNNASRSEEEIAGHISSLGVPATGSHVFGSALAGAELLAGKVPAGARVLVTGSAALVSHVRGQGLEPVESAADHPAAVIQGFDPGIGWKDLAEAAYAVAAGALWVATNTDMSIPQARGIAPGNGTLVAAVAAATGKSPLVAGKPHPPLFLSAAAHLGSQRPLVVGDRLDTDILGGNRAGMDTALVLTGVDTVHTALAAANDERPRYLLPDLGALFAPYPNITADDGGGFRCGAARAEVRDGVVVLRGERDSLDAWRAACTAWWDATPDQRTRRMPEVRHES